MAAPASQQGLSSRQKIVGVLAAFATIAALIVVYKLWATTQVHVERSLNLPAGSSEKMQAMKAKGQSADEGASDNINPGQMQRK